MKLKHIIFAALAIALTVPIGCKEENEPIVNPEEESAEENYMESKIPASEDIILTDDDYDVNKKLNVFAFRFFNEAVKTELDNAHNGNIIVSPLSASLVLTLLANSADDRTTDEIVDALGGKDLPTLNSASNKLMRLLSSRRDGKVIDIANSVWYNKDETISGEYIDNIAGSLYAECQGVNFSDASTLDVINRWGSEYTHGLIPHFLNSVPTEDVLILNAMFFGGKWLHEFDKADTRDMPFYGTKSTGTVAMMHHDIIHGERPSGKAAYLESDLFEAACIDIKYGATLFALLPKEGHTAEELAKSISLTDTKALKYDRYKVLILDFPRFKASTDINLMNTFANMGLPTSASLDKMGINTQKTLGSAQKTEIELDEEGIKIAAMTSVWAGDDLPEKEPEIKHLVFDRPFIFYVQATNLNTTIMAGLINNL